MVGVLEMTTHKDTTKAIADAAEKVAKEKGVEPPLSPLKQKIADLEEENERLKRDAEIAATQRQTEREALVDEIKLLRQQRNNVWSQLADAEIALAKLRNELN